MKSKKDLEDFLNKRPSYIKKGAVYISKMSGVDIGECSDLLYHLRKGEKMIDQLEQKELDDDTQLAAIKYYIDQKEYRKAKRIISKLETKKDVYLNPEIRTGAYIVMGCMHFPFHNEKMWSALLKIISDEKKLKGIVLAGDILDMHSISRHAKGKITLPDYDLTQEYEETNIELDKLDQAIGDRDIIKEYFYGNHEDWFNQWGYDADNYKLGEAGAISPYDYCFKKRGYNAQFNWKRAGVEVGDIKIIHGEWTNIHSAYKHMMHLHRKIVFFHTHRINTFYESDIYGLNCGWGGDKDKKVFNYASDSTKSRWKNGFCVIDVTRKGIFPKVVPFENGRFHYKGKIY